MMPISIIRCVFFDLGHVLINVDIDKCLRSCAKKSDVPLAEWIKAKQSDGIINKDFELGKITPIQYYEQLCSVFKLKMTYDEFVETYCNIFSLNPKVEVIARRLVSKVKLSIISNTDILHYSHIVNTYEIMSLFENPITSFEVGIMKPETEIYQLALDKMGVKAEQSVFVDDRLENVKGAENVGMYGIHYHTNTDLQKEFARFSLFI
jgi:HAD superfamily hydrolase (TIGR01509 family)